MSSRTNTPMGHVSRSNSSVNCDLSGKTPSREESRPEPRQQQLQRGPGVIGNERRLQEPTYNEAAQTHP